MLLKDSLFARNRNIPEDANYKRKFRGRAEKVK